MGAGLRGGIGEGGEQPAVAHSNGLMPRKRKVRKHNASCYVITMWAKRQKLFLLLGWY